MTIFDYVRENNSKSKGKLSQAQTDSVNAILSAWNIYGDKDKSKLAYIFATIKWETAHTFLPIKEYNWAKRIYAKLVNGHRYYGRGFVQLTWNYNYKKLGSAIGVDLLNQPDLALDTKIAAQIAVQGMMKGLFTGKKLADYINDTNHNYISSRKIINGTDKATEIATLANNILTIL